MILELTKLVFLRGEEFTDYNFEVWIDYWNGKFTITEIQEMIEIGKALPKFGTTKLAIGNLISKFYEEHPKYTSISLEDLK